MPRTHCRRLHLASRSNRRACGLNHRRWALLLPIGSSYATLQVQPKIHCSSNMAARMGHLPRSERGGVSGLVPIPTEGDRVRCSHHDCRPGYRTVSVRVSTGHTAGTPHGRQTPFSSSILFHLFQLLLRVYMYMYMNTELTCSTVPHQAMRSLHTVIIWIPLRIDRLQTD